MTKMAHRHGEILEYSFAEGEEERAFEVIRAAKLLDRPWILDRRGYPENYPSPGAGTAICVFVGITNEGIDAVYKARKETHDAVHRMVGTECNR
jgi:hypothetical protein